MRENSQLADVYRGWRQVIPNLFFDGVVMLQVEEVTQQLDALQAVSVGQPRVDDGDRDR